MPPVMGIAAFVLAALSTVPYSEVIIAAFIPAVAYFLAFFDGYFRVQENGYQGY